MQPPAPVISTGPLKSALRTGKKSNIMPLLLRHGKLAVLKCGWWHSCPDQFSVQHCLADAGKLCLGNQALLDTAFVFDTFHDLLGLLRRFNAKLVQKMMGYQFLKSEQMVPIMKNKPGETFL